VDKAAQKVDKRGRQTRTNAAGKRGESRFVPVSAPESLSGAEAGKVLGLSVRSVRRLCAEGKLRSFRSDRTAGGHLRVVRGDIEAFRQGSGSLPPPAPSNVLQARRDSVAGAVLEGDELQAKRRLRGLKAEDEEERQEKREARAAAAADRRNETESLRQARQRRDYDAAVKVDRRIWTELTLLRIPPGIPADRQQTILEGIIRMPDEIVCDPELAEPFIRNLLRQHIDSWQAETKARATRAQVSKEIIQGSLPFPLAFDDSVRAHADELIRQKFDQLPLDTSRSGLVVAAEEALQPLLQKFHSQQAHQAALTWAIRELPSSASELDRASLQKRCKEILAATQGDDESELRAALHAVVSEVATLLRARDEREQRERQARQESDRREANKQEFIRWASITVGNYKQELRDEGTILPQEYSDQRLWDGINEDVREQLSQELTGDETSEEVKDLIRGIVDDAFELESPEEDQG